MAVSVIKKQLRGKRSFMFTSSNLHLFTSYLYIQYIKNYT